MHRLIVAGLLAGLLIPSRGAAQDRPACAGAASDTLWQGLGPVYLACEVDKPARRRGGQPALDLDPLRLRARTTCQRVTLAFVVDTLGVVELPTVRTVASDHPMVEEAVRLVVAELRYTPARKGDQLVRQVVEYPRSVATPQRVAFTIGRLGDPLDAPVADPPGSRVRSC